MPLASHVIFVLTLLAVHATSVANVAPPEFPRQGRALLQVQKAASPTDPAHSKSDEYLGVAFPADLDSIVVYMIADWNKGIVRIDVPDLAQEELTDVRMQMTQYFMLNEGKGLRYFAANDSCIPTRPAPTDFRPPALSSGEWVEDEYIDAVPCRKWAVVVPFFELQYFYWETMERVPMGVQVAFDDASQIRMSFLRWLSGPQDPLLFVLPEPCRGV